MDIQSLSSSIDKIVKISNCYEIMTIVNAKMAQFRQSVEIKGDPPLTNRGKILLDRYIHSVNRKLAFEKSIDYFQIGSVAIDKSALTKKI